LALGACAGSVPKEAPINGDDCTMDGGNMCQGAADCSSDQFRCPGPNGQCIGRDKLCDGKKDCAGGEDEKNCCGQGHIKCSDGTCIPASEGCDGEGSGQVVCKPGEYLCASGSQCVSGTARCSNGPSKCNDASDKAGCPTQSGGMTACVYNQFTCGDGTCIPMVFICDGKKDCAGGEDENNCNLRCGPGTFQCTGGRPQCISMADRCTGNVKCADGSDQKCASCLNECNGICLRDPAQAHTCAIGGGCSTNPNKIICF
jgi:hypothetical protein